MGIVETKVKQRNIRAMANNLWPSWNQVDNCGNGAKCRIIVGWNPNIWDLKVVDKGTQFITCDILSLDKQAHMFVTYVYGANVLQNRRRVWDHLAHFSNSLNVPWVVLGDFNNIRYIQENEGRSMR